MTDQEDAEINQNSINKMAPPSKNENHCGNCWLPIGTTEWCPQCRIYNGTNGYSEEFNEANYEW